MRARRPLLVRHARRDQLARHGDSEEQTSWRLFLGGEFPQYEAFWQLFVVELTERVHDPSNIAFRPQAELDEIGRPPWRVAVAQLHYATLLHLMRAFELRQSPIKNRDSFLEAIVRLDASTDTAFELLGRCILDDGRANAWSDMAGRNVRLSWVERETKKEGKRPLDDLHKYRNALLHGRVRLERQLMILNLSDSRTAMVPCYPSFKRMSDALDWRKAGGEKPVPANELVNEAWKGVLDYLRKVWDEDLLPWARENFTAPEVPAGSYAARVLGLGNAIGNQAEAYEPRETPGSVSPS